MSDQFSVAIHGCLDMGWPMLVTWGVRREGNFGRQGGGFTATSSVLACFSQVPPVTCHQQEGECCSRPFVKGKIILAGQQLYRMKEWLELCGTEKMVVVREKPQHRATWCVHISGGGRQAGWDDQRQSLPFWGNLCISHLPRNFPARISTCLFALSLAL